MELTPSLSFRSLLSFSLSLCQPSAVFIERSLFYLLSNNHVNDMIMFDFRLEDEEVLSHFASFLKTLSLRLNPNTVQVKPLLCRRALTKINTDSFRSCL